MKGRGFESSPFFRYCLTGMMNNKHYNRFISFFIAFPLVFILLFFAYFPPCFDVMIYTGNIVGEGTCSSYLCSNNESFAHLYEGSAYFGSELETLRLTKLRYDTETVVFNIYDIEEADIVSLDISMFGYNVAHLNKDGLSHPLNRTVHAAMTSTEEPLVHIVFDESQESTSIAFPGRTIIPAWIWITYFVFIIITTLILAIGLSFVIERWPNCARLLLSASAVMVSILAGAYFCGSFPYTNYTYLLLNWLVFYAASLLVGAITMPWLGTVLTMSFATVWYIANYFVISLRNKPIMPADLKAIGTATEVMGGYTFAPSLKMIFGVLAVIIYICIVIISRKRNLSENSLPIKKKIIRRCIVVVMAFAMLFVSVHNSAFAALNSFQWDANLLEGFHRQGIALTYIKGVMSSHVSKPEGYSRDTVNAYLAEYEASLPDTVAGVQPINIIMIMNEAFSDLRTVGLDERIDVMPFIDSLQDSTVEGSLYVSVYGGGTCNTEFEALTGNSLAFMGVGAYPYTENVTETMFSLASYFRDNGYATEAFHANRANNWNRNMVYPNLGFGAFHSIDNYPPFTAETYLHTNPADIADYLYIESVSQEYSGKSRFLFNVTMQNHSGYEHWEDVEKAESVEKYGSDLYQDAQVYLSLIKASDDEIRQLIEIYKNCEDPTMIIFFGDHQPGLPPEARNEIYTTANNAIDMFKSKFFIWTNYETEAVHNVSFSANYLPYVILERGNFPIPPYIQLLKDVHDKYPIITSQGVIDVDGNLYGSVNELLDDPLIRKYQYVQYANMFDEIDPSWFDIK